MHLKKLEIVGFKTFADETEIEFDPGFTAVVGPNGSGKSNIVDAIKWIFGEKSAKGLRADKMDAVIFHGSELRKPAGFAEASVTFDNHDHFFKLDYPQVKITRRLYPDGVNEYYINDSRVNRKDVEKALMDTGIGKSSYSIMEQGRVDRILHSKPEERRLIFEEAAGISRFKVERQEALKKLEDTNQNLMRIDDIMSSMKRELEDKEKQAEKAEIYFQLKDRLEASDKNIRFLKWQDIHAKLQKVEKDLEDTKRKNEDLMSEISEESKEIESLEHQRAVLEKKITDIDKELLDHLSQTKLQKEKIEKNKSIIQDYGERILNTQQTLSSEKEGLSQVVQEFEENTAGIQEMEEAKESLQSSLGEMQKLRSQKEENIENKSAEIRNLESRIEANDKRHADLREKMKEVILELVSELEEKKKETLEREEKRTELKATLIQTADMIVEAVSDTLECLEEEEYEASFAVLKTLDLDHFKANLEEFVGVDDAFRHLLFDKDGVLGRKEELDREMEDLILESENHTRRIKELNQEIETLRIELDEQKEKIVEVEKHLVEVNSEKNARIEAGKSLELRRQDLEKRVSSAQSQISELERKKEEFEKEVADLEKETEDSYNQFVDMSKALESQKAELKSVVQKVQDLKSGIQKNQEAFQKLLPVLTEKERLSSGLKVQLDSFNEELYNDYSMTDSELAASMEGKEMDRTKEELELKSVKSEMQALGQINPLSIDEHKRIREIYEHHESQKADIIESKRDIEEVLESVNRESEKLFLETFEKIRTNFQETFTTLFNGGRATLELTDQDSLNAGIEIMAEPPGKHVQNLRLLSGGEKSMSAIALLFAIYMVKPSPFCFLDEIDAALDEANKLRFCKILDKFKDKTQFIVVTHAQSTIQRANTIFGVTNEEPGVSKILSLRLDEAREIAGHLSQAG